jgi:hypothetical protein
MSTKLKCPFCNRPEVFRPIDERTPEPKDHIAIPRVGKFWQALPNEMRGYKIVPILNESDHWRISLYKGHPGTGKYFTDKFKHFKLDLIGTDYELEPPEPVAVPFFLRQEGFTLSSSKPYWNMEVQRPSNPYWMLFNACRISHDKSDVVINAHWWPDHGNIFSIHGFQPTENSNKDLLITKEAMEFFRVETRGAPKIAQANLIKAIKEEGERATQRSIAKALKISDSTLRYWLNREGKSWGEIKAESIRTNVA